MADVVDLRSRQPISSEGEFNAELVTDLARFSEGLVSEKDIKRRYRFDAAVWESLGDNEALFAAIEDEKVRRVRSGALKRERAQIEIVDAPPILGGIARNPNANERHRIDSIKTLDALATGGSSEAAAAGTRFEIFINIGDQTLHFDKPIAIDANPNRTDDMPQDEWLPVIAASERKDDGGGQGHI
jgi:hypothetical protein